MKVRKNKENKKINIMNIVKIMTVVFTIVLIAMVGLVGVYKQNKNQMINGVKDYSLSMFFNGGRVIKLSIHDAEGTIVVNEDEEYDEHEEENTEEEKKEYTADDYKKSMNILEKRLKKIGVEEYTIRLNEENGDIEIKIPENKQTDAVVSYLSQNGKFEIIDSETEDILMTNDDIKTSKMKNENGIILLEIAFNDDAKEKFKEITETYTPIKNEDTEIENETEESTSETTKTEKKITMKVDDSEIMSTSFEKPITNGKFELSVGSSAAIEAEYEEYKLQAKGMAAVLGGGKLSATYELEKNQYILPYISKDIIKYTVVAISAIVILGIVILIVKFKLNGLLVGIAFIGLLGLYALILRNTNVIISIESIASAMMILVFNYIFTWTFLNFVKNNKENKKENPITKAINETYKKYLMMIIILYIIIIAFCFVKWIPINSFGMTAFWGLVVITIYNYIITKNLLSIKENR